MAASPGTTSRRKILLGTVTAAVLFAAGCSSDDGSGGSGSGPELETIKMGVIAIGTADDVRKQYEHTASELSAALGGTNVELVTSTDFFTIVEGLTAKRLDIGFLGSLSYVLGDQRADLEPMVVGVNGEGKPGYYSYLVTNDPAISGPADVRGRKLAMGSKLGTSTYLFPVVALEEVGIDPAKDTTLAQGGNSATNILAVKQGAADAAFVDSVEYETAVKKGRIDPNEVRKVWQSELITGSPVVIRADLPATEKERVEAALLTLAGTDEYPLGIEKAQRFTTVEESFYDPIRELAAQAGLSADSLKPN